MRLETFIWHALLRAYAKFGANRTVGGTIIKLYVENIRSIIQAFFF